MNDQVKGLDEAPKKLVLAGFGIGWSWCAAAVQLGPMFLPPVVRVPDVARPGEFEAMTQHEVAPPDEPAIKPS
jgi:hypothetical protein